MRAEHIAANQRAYGINGFSECTSDRNVQVVNKGFCNGVAYSLFASKLAHVCKYDPYILGWLNNYLYSLFNIRLNETEPGPSLSYDLSIIHFTIT